MYYRYKYTLLERGISTCLAEDALFGTDISILQYTLLERTRSVFEGYIYIIWLKLIR